MSCPGHKSTRAAIHAWTRERATSARKNASAPPRRPPQVHLGRHRAECGILRNVPLVTQLEIVRRESHAGQAVRRAGRPPESLHKRSLCKLAADSAGAQRVHERRGTALATSERLSDPGNRRAATLLEWARVRAASVSIASSPYRAAAKLPCSALGAGSACAYRRGRSDFAQTSRFAPFPYLSSPHQRRSSPCRTLMRLSRCSNRRLCTSTK